MKIAHVVTWFDETLSFGGPVRVAINQAEALAKAGHTVTLYSSGPHTSITALPNGVQIRVHKGFRLGNSFWATLSPGLLVAVLRDGPKYDSWHLHLSRDLTTMISGLALLLRKSPYVVQTHGMLSGRRRFREVVYDILLAKKVVHRANVVFHLTEFEAKSLRMQFPKINRLLKLINGVPDAEFASHANKTPMILFLSRLHSRKNPMVFLEAANSHQLRHETLFEIGGQDEGEGQAVSAWVSAKASPRIKYLGAVSASDVGEKLKQSWALALPSSDEPFPMIVLEALSHGVPVIVSNTCGLKNSISHAEAGIVIEPVAASLAAAFEELIDPKRNEVYSRNAWNLARNHFSMDGVRKVLEESYLHA